jgi:hypothetical protein
LMLLAWLLPDETDRAADGSWSRPAYQPRHGKPSPVMRAGLGAAALAATLRQRYLGDAEPAASVRPGRAVGYFQRKWTKTRPKFFESFSIR